MTVKEKGRAAEGAGVEKRSEFVTLMMEDQLFGIPVLQVQDVIRDVRVTRVPLSPPEIAGNLNLRGRIVVAIDMRRRLSMKPRAADAKFMNVVVESKGELYSLIVDRVGEVLSLADSRFERNPPTLARHLRDISKGIFQLDERLLVILDVSALLAVLEKSEAA
jgi:purine-binding chemotaxis protein CheW